MKSLHRIAAALLASAGLLTAGASLSPALAAAAPSTVFVQTDALSGNQIVAYDRHGGGHLEQIATYATGGLGGQLTGSASDHLASQGGLAYDRQDGLLLAVNAGSNTLAVFGVYGQRLALRQDIPTGGTFPASVTVGNGRVYVLNTAAGGDIQGYSVQSGRLVPIPGANVPLGLPQEAPQFTHTPGQIALTPDDSKIVVTTKAATNSIDVFDVAADGTLSAPVVNSEPGAVPFAVTFDQQGHLVVAEAAGALVAFQLQADDTLAQLDSVATEQAATCWVTQVHNRYYTSNTGSASVTGFFSSQGGNLLTNLGNTTTDAGPVDSATTPGEHFLFVQTGIEGKVDEFEVGAKGELTRIGAVTVPGAIGGEGIVVT
jgi:6-phosphogluconolactonase (cycloisomerase 2 family)